MLPSFRLPRRGGRTLEGPASPAPSSAGAPDERRTRTADPSAPDVDGQDDEQRLLARVRAGDQQAITELYTVHRPIAVHLARRVCPPSDVEDVVSEAFTRVLDQLARGGGPRVSFRAYLITAVRSVSADVARRRARLVPADVDELQREARTPSHEQPQSAMRVESRLLSEALASLPPRWQLAVWWTTVEGRSLAEVGEALGLNANAAAALAFRARDGLRDAYLALHVEESAHTGCNAWRTEFPSLVRGRLAPARTAATTAHLTGCASCREVHDQLRALLVTGVPH